MKSILCTGMGLMSAAAACAATDGRPNFVWLMGEDIAPQFMALYNDGEGAKTPCLDEMAREGLVFDNAYSNAPVSSAARSTLITASYAPKHGISFHRKLEELNMPETFRMFPAYLRQAGYFTANSSKTDYNCMMDTCAWDMVKSKLGDWRLRKQDNQPFLFVRTNAASHESCLHFTGQQMKVRKTMHNPDEVKLMPQHPDTPLMRYTYATFYDRIHKVDDELGRMIEMLKEDGLIDNTFIFYFGDNGGSLPGSKGYTTETGLKVPLVVYVPEKWRKKLPVECGSRIDGMVSFIDLGPTLLHLAGIDVPNHMDGTPFLGTDISTEQMNGRDVVYGYGDRFDELYAFHRTVRKGDFKYQRNFQPYHPKSLYSYYRYKQLAFRQWKTMYDEGKLDDVQARFFQPQGAEELYDLKNDPYETNNLANRKEYAGKLNELRRLLDRNMLSKADLGLLPECVWLEEGRECPYTYGLKSEKRIARMKKIADMQLVEFAKVERSLKKSLRADDAAERWWALTVCASFGHEAVSLKHIAETMLNDDNAYVRMRAMVFLSMLGHEFPKADVIAVLKSARVASETLLILNDVAYLMESGLMKAFTMQMSDIHINCERADWRVDYINELNKIK